MDIIFCCDRSVLPGLHVAAYSLLERMNPSVKKTRFTLFSEALNEADVALLRQTLNATAKPFTLELRRMEKTPFSEFRSLNSSWATYYRLHAARSMEVEQFLYMDADTLCDVDVSELQLLDLAGAPAGWVTEAPLPLAVDREVAEQLGNRPDEFYFNAGVMLVNTAEWRRQQVSEKAMEYIVRYRPAFHDQSALNCVLRGRALGLDARFNCMANMRKNWLFLKSPYGQIGRLVHFVDYPKPWDFLGEWLHPQYRLWRSVLDRTAMKGFRSWQDSQARKFPRNQQVQTGYKKAAKDRLLFAGYLHGWLKHVKGTAQ